MPTIPVEVPGAKCLCYLEVKQLKRVIAEVC